MTNMATMVQHQSPVAGKQAETGHKDVFGEHRLFSALDEHPEGLNKHVHASHDLTRCWQPFGLRRQRTVWIWKTFHIRTLQSHVAPSLVALDCDRLTIDIKTQFYGGTLCREETPQLERSRLLFGSTLHAASTKSVFRDQRKHFSTVLFRVSAV